LNAGNFEKEVKGGKKSIFFSSSSMPLANAGREKESHYTVPKKKEGREGREKGNGVCSRSVLH